MSLSSLLVVILFTFGTSIFYILLIIENRTWRLALPGKSGDHVAEADVRFVHQSLKRLIPFLPPSNGIVVVGGLACLIWQGFALSWSVQAIVIIAYYLALQIYILTFGQIAAAIADVWRTASDGDLIVVRRGVRRLVQQHFNGLLHAAGVLFLELTLIVLPLA